MRFHHLWCLIPLTLAVASAPAGAQSAAQAKANLKMFKVRQASADAELGGAAMVSIENKFGHVWVKAGTPHLKIEQTAYTMGKSQADATAGRRAFASSPSGTPKKA